MFKKATAVLAASASLVSFCPAMADDFDPIAYHREQDAAFGEMAEFEYANKELKVELTDVREKLLDGTYTINEEDQTECKVLAFLQQHQGDKTETWRN
jgi:hypothetical protein